VEAEMLLYMTTTNLYYFPVVTVPVMVLCLTINKSTLPVTLLSLISH